MEKCDTPTNWLDTPKSGFIRAFDALFFVNKEYYVKLLKRQTILEEKVSPRVAIHSTLITTFGLTQNEYSNAFSNVIVLDDLFKDE